MKSSRRFRHSSTTTTTTKTVPYTFRNDHSALGSDSKITQIPIQPGTEVEQSSSKPIPITVHLRPSESTAAVKIQACYRSHLIRPLVRKISAVNSEANYWQRIIQRQA
ncbi:hypothetical protein RD792_007627 [Penstemon davidsonii]|uniref:Uncharacterized protein n=1 Tax=Penstemon davidsonii TaxID=160366 RepID=A0ABR0D6X9_9LAMI|nr:hypothetical protein RD792_007627 [Penstemon davidsonii]